MEPTSVIGWLIKDTLSSKIPKVHNYKKLVDCLPLMFSNLVTQNIAAASLISLVMFTWCSRLPPLSAGLGLWTEQVLGFQMRLRFGLRLVLAKLAQIICYIPHSVQLWLYSEHQLKWHHVKLSITLCGKPQWPNKQAGWNVQSIWVALLL